MADNLISRRTVVPGLAASATAALAGAVTISPSPAAAGPGRRRFGATAGPCALWRGHTLGFHFFLPAGQRGGDQALNFSLIVQTLDGGVIVRHDFELMPGMGTEALLVALGDGSVRFGDETIKGLTVPAGGHVGIIAILIGLLLPAVQKPRGTLTSFVAGRAAGELNVNYILPYIEQDNLFR